MIIIAALIASGLYVAYLRVNRTPGELIRYTDHRLIGHPKIEFVALPILGIIQSFVERPVPALVLPSLGKGARIVPAAAPLPSTGRVFPVATVADLQKALNEATAGTTIELLPGHYRVSRPLTTRHKGSSAAPIVVRADRLGSVTLDFNILEGFHVTQPYWTFENLDIQGVCKHDSNCEHAFHVVSQAHNVVIRNNRIRDFNAIIKVNGEGNSWPDDGTIEWNSLTNSRPRHTNNPVTLLDIDAVSGWRVDDNVIENFVKQGGNGISYGVFMKGGGSNGRIERNLIVCTTTDISQAGERVGLSFGGGGTGQKFCRHQQCDAEHRNGIAANNVIAHCNDFGIDVNRSVGIDIANNTLINTAGIEVRNAPATALIRGNLLEGRISARKGGKFDARQNLVTGLSSYLRSPDSLNLGWVSRPKPIQRDPQVTKDFCLRPRPMTTMPGALGTQGPCAVR